MPAPRPSAPPLLAARVVWGAMVAAVLALLAAAVLARPSFVRPPARPLEDDFLAFMHLTAGGLTLVALVAVRLLAPVLPVHRDVAPGKVALARSIASGAICEAPAVFALVDFLVTGERLALAIFAVAFAGLLATFPTAARFARLGGGAAADGAAGGAAA